ncbi:molybdopterin molybdotransferase MoeA [Ideonella dechloratans]|uniref:Molybdopterin molybdenumtransferase n=1 Tax=Ideonella dechloratans TaxID=36863 RepID=A0A643FDN0_IDEDE|nr:gephyrin-like molybdotransferase Glp [Ideonella dechloratans]KAB0583304.1 molybdopterin molybdotransferase MoeA [Ideonella dechloratans]UFU11225.1 molybdopterin molybdotransferase MoeA [Ideonella dechloratans]
MSASTSVAAAVAAPLSVAEARQRIASAVAGHGQKACEVVDLMAALGRVLAEDVLAPQDVPPHDNSAMDGFAFAGQALVAGQATRLRVVGRALAGHPFAGSVAPGDCVRIMTGAVMPAGTDTVVPFERCEQQDDVVFIAPKTVRAGDNRRHRGEDLAVGAVALPAGRRLRPADLGLAASLGLSRLSVRRRLAVALFSSGDELRSPGEALAPGCLYDSNRFMLAATLTQLGCEVLDLGRVPDDPKALDAVLHQAIERADAVVTSGGVSVGDADHTRAVLARHGPVDFWSVAMRPGRPFAFGRLERPDRAPCWFFALPGNPVAALVSFQVLAREALLALAGAECDAIPPLAARCVEPIRKRPGRAEFARVRLSLGPDGHAQAQAWGGQSSAALSALVGAHGLAVLQSQQGDVGIGDWMDVLPFEGLC